MYIVLLLQGYEHTAGSNEATSNILVLKLRVLWIYFLFYSVLTPAYVYPDLPSTLCCW